jgi:hypothetical protein
MGIRISVAIDTDHICVRSWGRFSSGAYEQTVRTVVDAVLIYGRSSVLIDATGVTGPVSEDQLTAGPAYLVDEVQSRAPGSIRRLAFLCDRRHFDIERRGESVANSGGIPTRVFTDRDEAIIWLSQ